jgi:hypothetical protein
MNLDVTVIYFANMTRPPTNQLKLSLPSVTPDDFDLIRNLLAAKITEVITDRTAEQIEALLQRQVKIIDNGTILGGGLRVMFVYKDPDGMRAVFAVMENKL